MKKIFATGFYFFLLSFLFLYVSPQKVQAACSYSLTPTTADPSQNINFVVSGNGNDCFSKTIPYYIFVYPAAKDSNPGSWISFFGHFVRGDGQVSSDSKTLPFYIDLSSNQTVIKGYENQQWMVRVCSEQVIACRDHPEKYLITDPPLEFRMGITSAPTLPPAPNGLPIVREPLYCSYKQGSEVPLKIVNLEPNTKYMWWWHNDWGESGTFNTSAGQYESALTIPGTYTNTIGIKTFCVHKVALLAEAYCQPSKPDISNSITLYFYKPTDNPPADSSCRNNILAPTATPGPPPPPCAEWTTKDGTPLPTTDPRIQDADAEKICKKVATAIGSVDTNPVDFIKRIFVILLSLSGGVILYLIFTSGYKLMMSQGNAEKVQEAKDTITSAIVGFLFIVFSVVILEIIGVDIFAIPGFSR